MKSLTETIRNYINLIESKSADLYHGTSLDGADGILESNYLEVNSWGAHDFDDDSIYPSTVKGHDEASSLTRNFNVAKGYVQNHDSGAIIVLDQELLARDLGKRLRPVDIHGFDDYNRRSKDEELVYGGIRNVKKYIKNIYVFVDDPDELNEFETLRSYPKTKIVPTANTAPTHKILQHNLSQKTQPGLGSLNNQNS